MKYKSLFILIALALLMVACGTPAEFQQYPDPTATAAPTPTPQPMQTLAETLQTEMGAIVGEIKTNNEVWQYAVTTGSPKAAGFFGLPEGITWWDIVDIPTVKQMYWNTDIEIVREDGTVTLMEGQTVSEEGETIEGQIITLSEKDYPEGIFFTLWIKSETGMKAQLYKLATDPTN